MSFNPTMVFEERHLFEDITIHQDSCRVKICLVLMGLVLDVLNCISLFFPHSAVSVRSEESTAEVDPYTVVSSACIFNKDLKVFLGRSLI